MIELYPKPGGAGEDRPAWVDLLDPTAEEVAGVERRFDLQLPTRDALAEIEASSRTRRIGEALAMSAPLLTRAADGSPLSAPTGFILTAEVCLTLRFAPSAAFDAVRTELASQPGVPAHEVFVRLLEEVVDRAADHFETTSEALDEASHAIFRLDPAKGGGRKRLSTDARRMRETMSEIGRASERMSRVRYSLVCIGRMAQFVSDRAKARLDAPLQDRLATVRADVASLEQYEENMMSRVQFLQDAATAFISIEQNDVVKVLTIASVVGVPPVLIAGVYGMNFKNMPELTWTYGYPYSLALIVVSALVPLAWFKWKGWM